MHILQHLADELLYFSPKPISFGGFAKAPETNNWDKRQLEEGNRVAPVRQMFSKFLNH